MVSVKMKNDKEKYEILVFNEVAGDQIGNNHIENKCVW